MLFLKQEKCVFKDVERTLMGLNSTGSFVTMIQLLAWFVRTVRKIVYYIMRSFLLFGLFSFSGVTSTCGIRCQQQF